MSTTYKVTGMTCGGCASAVTNAIKRLAPGAQVKVELGSGQVEVAGAAIPESEVKRAVETAGFGFAGPAAAA